MKVGAAGAEGGVEAEEVEAEEAEAIWREVVERRRWEPRPVERRRRSMVQKFGASVLLTFGTAVTGGGRAVLQAVRYRRRRS